MNFTEYQKEALKTRSDRWNSKSRNYGLTLFAAVAAIASEAGEICTSLKNSFERGVIYDIDNLNEEAGDLLWYLTNFVELLNGSSFGLDSVAVQNIIKLRKRHGEKFDPTELAFRDGSTTINSGIGGQIGGPNNNPQGNPNMERK